MTTRGSSYLGAWAAFLSLLSLTLHPLQGAVGTFEPLAPLGETMVHDPSTILRENSRYFLFGTGRGIQTKSSSDLRTWVRGPSVFNVPPEWTTNAVPGYRGHTWAPDAIRVRDKVYLYYSVSTFGRQISAIGLARGSTIDPSAPAWSWDDAGPVIQSTNGSPFNAIDPGVLLDPDGRLWMTFGSFWKGIHLLELDPATGLRADDQPPRQLAWAEAIEAPCLTRRGAFYYLFVNWGRCCRGTNSTYEVRVGRSHQVTGPYRDREGRDLVDGGGTLFLETAGRFIGPGHMGILHAEDGAWFSYHYYDAATQGRSRLALGRLGWTEDDWPVPIATADLKR